jgi:DNA repair ATPase RecN
MLTGVSLARQRQDWSRTLVQFEQTLTEALDMVEERQRALDAWIQSTRSASDESCCWPQGLEVFYQRMQELQQLADRAAASVTEIDTALADGETALQQWLTASEAARLRLSTFLKKDRLTS